MASIHHPDSLDRLFEKVAALKALLSDPYWETIDPPRRPIAPSLEGIGPSEGDIEIGEPSGTCRG